MYVMPHKFLALAPAPTFLQFFGLHFSAYFDPRLLTLAPWTLDMHSRQAGGSSKFLTLHEQFPLFSSAHLHSDYVDCVRWVGDLLLSKSTASKV
jgi:hypothetical protein